MQKFDVNNLEFQYIQALLYDTFIPTIPVFSYVPTKEELKEMYEKDSYTSMCIIPSYVISFNKEGEIQQRTPYEFGKFYPGITTNFINVQNYYNSSLHEALGNYLRAYRDYYQIDLMPLYNCFPNRYINTFSLPIKYKTDETDVYHIPHGVTPPNSRTTIAVIPVRNNCTYQIAYDSRGAALTAQYCYLKGNELLVCPSPNVLQDVVDPMPSLKIQTSWEAPQTITVNINGSSEKPFDPVHSRASDKYLYLLIELPTDNPSSLVVLERFSDYDYCLHPQLLKTNTYSQVAFSDKLFQYLTHNVIVPGYQFQSSIAEIQKVLASKAFEEMYKTRLDKYIPGTFDTGFNSTHSVIYTAFRNIKVVYTSTLGPEPIRDFTGYIDKDVEDLILKARSTNIKTDTITTTGY